MAVVAFSDPDFIQDPYPAIAEHRSKGVVPNTDQGGWWVLDSDTIWKLIRDPKLANDPAAADPDAPITKIFSQSRLSMFYMDPPDHTRVRGSVKADFAPRQVDKYASGIASTTKSLISRLPDRGLVDLCAEFGDLLPMTVMSDFIGVEPERRGEFARWALIRINGIFDPAQGGPVWENATDELRGYFEERLAGSDDGVPSLLGRLVGVAELDDQEKVDLLLIMLGAGIITTADLIGNTLHALLTNPSEMELLRRQRELVPEAIEETLRYDSPALSVGRILTEDRDFFGQLIPAGSWLRIMTAAVGRDPARNPDPERYQIQRPNREQYAFGGGVHYCLGLHLGKLEAKIALDALLDRYQSMELAPGPESAVRRGTPGFRGFKSLIVDVA